MLAIILAKLAQVEIQKKTVKIVILSNLGYSIQIKINAIVRLNTLIKILMNFVFLAIIPVKHVQLNLVQIVVVAILTNIEF